MILSKKFTAICLTAFMVVFSGFNSSYAQNSTAKGTVVDQNGEPVIGASVMVKGTANGTTTNIDGAFTIADVKEGTTIEASFLGYVSTEAVWNGAVLKLVLQEDTATLDEVVVTALGMKKSAKALGYAMTELKEGQFNPNLINPVSQLQGKVAGVEINSSDGGMFGSTKILIRGASTLNANNQPIYVVDGIILDNAINNSSADWDTSSNDYGNELKNLNPDDFESVSVLKGAAATALYGSRGLNGAVVITTKSGKGSKGLGVSFTQTLGIDAVTSQPTFQNIYQEGAFAGYGTETSCPTDYDIHNSRLYSDKGNFISYPKVYDAGWYGESFGNRFDSSSSLEYYDGSIIPSKAYANNLKDMYDTGFNTNTNVAISGANEKGNFYLSLSEKYVKGTIPNNTFNRFSVLAKASRKISKDVELEVSTTFTNSKPRNAQQNFGDMFCNGGGFDRAYDPTYYRDKYKGEHGGLASTAYGDEYGKVPGRSIWWSIYENNTEQKETVVRPVIKLSVNFTPWMKWVTEGSYNYYYKTLETMNKGTGYANQGNDDGSGGYYRLAMTTKEQTNLNTNFLFNFDFNENWSFNGFLRGEFFDNRQVYLSENTSGGLVIPNQFFLANSRNGIQSTGNISATKKMFSVAAQAMVSYKNQLFLEVTGRNDWSSTLVYADGHGTFSYFYPSVSGSWILSETFKMPKAISFMKLRASFAQVGNDTQPYLINSAYSLNTYTKDGQKVNALSIPNTTYSNDLKPEIKTSWEVGLDYRMFNNRIGLDFAYYRENTRNQIMTVSVPSVSGVSNALINAGNIQNSGFEIALNTIPVETRDWTWNLNFTYTKNNSKIVELSDLVGDYITLQGNADYGNYRIASVAKVGGTYGMLMSDSAAKKDYTYDANGNITGGSGLPVITWREGERTAQYVRNGKVEEVGNSTPDFLGSINTSLRFKNWTLGVSLDGRFGGYVASFGSRYGTANGYTRTSLQYCDEEHGGITYTSKFDNVTYHDGVIPDAIFMKGTTIKQPDGSTYTVQSGATSANGETYRELFEKGLIEPSHASSYTFRQSAWSTGVINDNWFTKLNYIALRDISLTYRFPERIANRIKASNLSLMFNAHNVCYLLNTMPNGENPESVRGTAASEFRIRTFEGVTSSFTLTLKASF